MRVRTAAQLTLSAEVRRALNVKEGDYVEAQIVEGGVLLPADEACAALAVVAAIAVPWPKGPPPRPDALSSGLRLRKPF
jgi:hypothetical protein